MVGTKLLGQLGGGFGGLKGNVASSTNLGVGGFAAFAKNDGSGTERSNYLTKEAADKSFISSSGLGQSHGPSGGLNMGGVAGGLDSSLLNNILSTPSSEKSMGKGSRFSQDEKRE